MHGPAIDDEDGQIAAINIIPLVDVVLVLLIIFMVTMVFTKDSSIPLELPKGGKTLQSDSPPHEITVTVDKAGKYYVNGQQCQLEDLGKRVATFSNTTRNSVVVVRADKDIAYGKIIPVLEQTASAKTTITLAYTPQSGPAGA